MLTHGAILGFFIEGFYVKVSVSLVPRPIPSFSMLHKPGNGPGDKARFLQQYRQLPIKGVWGMFSQEIFENWDTIDHI